MAIAFDWLNDTNLTIASSAEVIYSNPSSTITTISKIWLHNIHVSAVTVTLYLVPDATQTAGEAGSGNQFLVEEMAAGEVIEIMPGFILGDTADTLQAVATVADKINIFVFGAKKT